ALIKARHYSEGTGKVVIADDSGLEVDALGGAPGIFSARYGGGTTDAARIKHLLDNLHRTGSQNRLARFVCVIALSDNQIEGTVQPVTFTGVCKGMITDEPRGTNGFGYDPIFIPDNFSKTFAELPQGTKSLISHRANAIKALYKFLEPQFRYLLES
ncbi:MAG: RdgB/HAM1 family non-canonical purine NTP pyrophosphatase, partial [Pyrinomonadaceae bacterium]